MLHRLWSPRLLAVVGVLAFAPACAGEGFLKDASFETAGAVQAASTPDIGFGVWTLGAGNLAPTEWTMNAAFPGELSVISGDAHSGQSFLRLRANGKRGVAHVYQPCPGLEAGKCYRVSAWFRGGKAGIGFYEYREDGTIACPTVLSASPGPGGWRQFSALYVPAGPGFKDAALAITALAGETIDVDDLQVEKVPNDVPGGLGPIVLEAQTFRLTISPRGALQEFTAKATGTNYAVADTPVFRVSRRGGEVPVHYVKRAGNTLEVHFLDPEIVAFIRCESRARYLTLTVQRVSGAGLDWFGLCELRLQITANVGTLVNAAWDDAFAVCALACNDRTDSFGADGARAWLCARCYPEYGVESAKVAILGVPLAPPGSTSRLLDGIEQVETDQGLPHPRINGVWLKRSKERFASYLMAGGASEANIDQVIEFAKGGFGCVEILNWWDSTPTYGVDPQPFPHGLAGLKRCVDRIHAAGMQVGLHCMQGMVGWGGLGMGDPHVSPKADPRLLQDRHATLPAPLPPEAKEITVEEGTSGWPDEGDLLIGGEVVRYGRRTETGFADCTRGLHGTTVGAHPEGAKVGHLVNVFGMWGSCIYAPDVNSTMVDEVCDNLAKVFNAVGADMSYFDGGEEIAAQPPHWHNQGRIALGVQRRLKKPVVLEGNALYTHLSWHVITRGSPSFDPIYYGRRDYTLRCKGQNPAGWAKNLLTGDVGWFAPHVWSPSTDAVTPDEVMLLCLKALGGKSPISFQLDCNNLWANRRMTEMLEIIRACDELKRREYFPDDVCRELTKPFAEHLLERVGGKWAVRPLRFGPPRVVNASAVGAAEWDYENPYAEQRPWVRIRARTRLAPYGARGNTVLADFEKEVPFRPDGSASAELVPSTEPSTLRTPDGSSSFCYRARNDGKGPSTWCRLSLTFPQVADLSAHRRLGVWVRAEGKGGILNVQLLQGYGSRDHYIDLNYEGWRYHELDPPETARFWDYTWPYSMIDLLYWVFQYGAVKGVSLYYNDLPPGETACLVGRIEALEEYPSPLQSPTLEAGGRKLTLPVSVQPEDYVELDWDGKCRHFERNGGLLGEVAPQGDLRLATGWNRVHFACAGSDNASPRAEITLSVKGDPLPNRAAKPSPAGREAEAKDLPSVALAPNGKGGFRVMRGSYEWVGAPPVHTIAAFDGVSNLWTVANDSGAPQRAALAIMRGRSALDVDYDRPRGLTLETFDDLAAYEMGEGNAFEKYVIGGGKQLAPCGPVREGVTQTFVPLTDDVRAGKSCAVYTATNEAGAGGWCAKGRRFAEPLDLSKYEAAAFWLCGDGKGETLRFQFRDVTGAPADWLVPIDFVGWRLQVVRLADTRAFDWTKVEYVIFYFNDIPARTTVTLRFDDLKVLPRARQPLSLSRLKLSVNGHVITLPVGLLPGEGVAVDEVGRGALWRSEAALATLLPRLQPVALQPGQNKLALSCDTRSQGIHDVSIRVVPLGP